MATPSVLKNSTRCGEDTKEKKDTEKNILPQRHRGHGVRQNQYFSVTVSDPHGDRKGKDNHGSKGHSNPKSVLATFAISVCKNADQKEEFTQRSQRSQRKDDHGSKGHSNPKSVLATFAIS